MCCNTIALYKPDSLLKQDAGVGCNKACFFPRVFFMSIAQWRKITPEKQIGEGVE